MINRQNSFQQANNKYRFNNFYKFVGNGILKTDSHIKLHHVLSWILYVLFSPFNIISRCIQITLAILYLVFLKLFSSSGLTEFDKLNKYDKTFSIHIFPKILKVIQDYCDSFFRRFNCDFQQIIINEKILNKNDKPIDELSKLQMGEISEQQQVEDEINDKTTLGYLSPLSYQLLNNVKRKVLILDLDETLIHSYHENNIFWRTNQFFNNPNKGYDNNTYSITNFYNYYCNFKNISSLMCIENKSSIISNKSTFIHRLNSLLNIFYPQKLKYNKSNQNQILGGEGLNNKYLCKTPSYNNLNYNEYNKKELIDSNYLLGKRNYNSYNKNTFSNPNLSSGYIATMVYFVIMFFTFFFVEIPRFIVESLTPTNSSTTNKVNTNNLPPSKEPDFILKLCIDRHPVRFFVYKRPHVDNFLRVISQWYDLVVYTASMQVYGSGVADKLDQPLYLTRDFFDEENDDVKLDHNVTMNGKKATNQSTDHKNYDDFKDNKQYSYPNSKMTTSLSQSCSFSQTSQVLGQTQDNVKEKSGPATILGRRYFRQHCKLEPGGTFSKDISLVEPDLSRVLLLDNSPAAYRSRHPQNGLHIASWFSDPTDRALLDLLPFLDALRFVTDVRSVLARNIHSVAFNANAANNQQPYIDKEQNNTDHSKLTSELQYAPNLSKNNFANSDGDGLYHNNIIGNDKTNTKINDNREEGCSVKAPHTYGGTAPNSGVLGKDMLDFKPNHEPNYHNIKIADNNKNAVYSSKNNQNTVPYNNRNNCNSIPNYPDNESFYTSSRHPFVTRDSNSASRGASFNRI